MKHLNTFELFEAIFHKNEIRSYLSDILTELEDIGFVFHVVGSEDNGFSIMIDKFVDFKSRKFNRWRYKYSDIEYPIQHAISYLKEKGFELDKISCPFNDSDGKYHRENIDISSLEKNDIDIIAQIRFEFRKPNESFPILYNESVEDDIESMKYDITDILQEVLDCGFVMNIQKMDERMIPDSDDYIYIYIYRDKGYEQYMLWTKDGKPPVIEFENSQTYLRVKGKINKRTGRPSLTSVKVTDAQNSFNIYDTILHLQGYINEHGYTLRIEDGHNGILNLNELPSPMWHENIRILLTKNYI